MKKWKDIKGEWNQDPDHAESMREEFPYREVADAVIGLRARLDLTQEELAQKVGTTQSVIARLESGKHPVSVNMLYRIARAVGISWHPVFEDEQAPAADRALRSVHCALRSAAGVFRQDLVQKDSSHGGMPHADFFGPCF